MRSRQSLLGPRNQIDPHGTSSTTFFDRLKDGWLQVGRVEKRKSVGQWRLIFSMASWKHARSRSHYIGIQAVLTAGTAGCRGVLRAQLAEMKMGASTG